MPFAIKNWKLAIITILFLALFMRLGFWQLSRAEQKKQLLQAFKSRLLQAPYSGATLNTNTDLRFYRAQLEGHFDNAHTLLLDNKTFHGQIGYEVYTPFIANELRTPILVDRGFIPLGTSREQLPTIRNIPGNMRIMGMLNIAPAYFALGKITASSSLTWPLRIEYVQLTELANILHTTLFPYILNLDPHDPAAYSVEWQIVNMGPERHQGYAVQWFALALTLLILFVVLNRR